MTGRGLTVIGVPFNSAGRPDGEGLAPSVLRAAGLIERMEKGADVLDVGNVEFESPTTERDLVSGIIAPRTLETMVAAVRRAVGEALALGRLPVVVGGECPLLLGCLAAARDAYGRVGLLFVDGHEDAYPPHASLSGESADMELGLALGSSPLDGLEEVASLLPLVRAEDVVVLGARDLDEITSEGAVSIGDRVTVRNDEDLREGGIAVTVGADAARLRENAGRWWLHVDLDALATSALAAVRYPQPGGLSWAELAELVASAVGVPGLVGMDVTIYNPDLDLDRGGAAQIVGFLERVAARL